MLFVFNDNYTLTLPFSVYPFTFKYFSVGIRVFTYSIFFVIFVKSLKFRMIRPSIGSVSMLFPIQKITFINLSVLIHDTTLSVEHIVLKAAIIVKIRCGIFSISMLDTIKKLTFVNYGPIASLPGFFSKAIRKISSPISLILQTIFLKYKFSPSLGLLIFQLTFIIPSINTDESSFSMRYTIFNVSDIIAAIRIKQFTSSMWHAIFPFSILLVDKAFFIQCVRKRLNCTFWWVERFRMVKIAQ